MKRFISISLSLLLMISLIPAAFAGQSISVTIEGAGKYANNAYTYEGGTMVTTYISNKGDEAVVYGGEETQFVPGLPYALVFTFDVKQGNSSKVLVGNTPLAVTLEGDKYVAIYYPTVDDVDLVFSVSVGPISFSDVKSGDWFYDSVMDMAKKGYITGTPDGKFLPNNNMTRAEFAVVLWRVAGKPATAAESKFTDVKSTDWYADAVDWASANGLINGYNGKFSPADKITREDAAVILYRYAKSNGKGYSSVPETKLNVPDVDSISDYAYEALYWFNSNGVIKGDENGNVNPKNSATRAELSAIIYRSLDIIK